MAKQGTRQEIERGEFQQTRREIEEKGRRQGISKLGIRAPRGRSKEEQFTFIINELNYLWTALRGGGDAKSTTYPKFRLSQSLDQEGRVYQIYDGDIADWLTGEDLTLTASSVSLNELAIGTNSANIALNSLSIGTNSTDIGALQAEEREIFIPAQSFNFDPAATNPAVWDFTVGATRNSSINIPTGSSNLYLWSSVKIPASWVGKIATARVHYALDTAPLTTSVVRVGATCYGYESGDGLTSPTVVWNENNDVDISSDSTATYYFTDKAEASASITEQDYYQLRVSFVRSNAAYTYTGTFKFFGLGLTVPAE